MTERYSRRDILKLALSAPVLLVACKGAGAENGSLGSEAGSVVVTPTEVPTVILPTEVPATPIPEKPNFGRYDVFMGDADGGGKVVITALPFDYDPSKGRVIIISRKETPTSSNPDHYLFVYTLAASYDSSGFMTRTLAKGTISGKLIDEQTVTGVMTQEGYTTSDGKETYPTASANFTIKKIGNGRKALLDSYRTAYGRLASGLSDAQLITSLQQACACTLPE